MTKNLRPNPTAILDPKVDPIFKSLFTNNSEEARFALESFLSAIFGEQVSDVLLDQNELPIESEKDKQSIFDLTCHLGNEKKVLNIEMQGWNFKNSFDNRSEYHVAHLLNHFVTKGTDWDEIPQSYMISVLNFIYDKKDDVADSLKYSMKNQRNNILKSQKLNIIYLELPKFNNLSEKEEDLKNLTPIQRWAKFLINANNPEKAGFIEQLSKLDSGIMAAKTVINRISQDDAEWRRERNYWDAVSNEITIRNRAIKEGHAEGHAKGHAEGLAKGHAEGFADGHTEGHAQGLAEGRAEGFADGHTEGLAEGLKQAYIETTKRLLVMNLSAEQIAQATQLSLEEINKIKEDL